MSGGNKRTFSGIDNHTLKQGEFTKMTLKDGRMLLVNTQNVDMIEIFAEEEELFNLKDMMHDLNKNKGDL